MVTVKVYRVSLCGIVMQFYHGVLCCVVLQEQEVAI